MPNIARQALLPYPAVSLFDIVNDVGRYSEFLPWCGDSKVLSQSEYQMEAAVKMQKGPLNHWFSTRNTLSPGKSIAIVLIDGPFKKLNGRWDFVSLDEKACRIELNLEFEFSSGVASTILTPIFTQIANTMVDSFCRRAESLDD